MAEKLSERDFCEYRNLVLHEGKIHALFYVDNRPDKIISAGIKPPDECSSQEDNYMYVPINDLPKRFDELHEMGCDGEQTRIAMMAYEGVLALLNQNVISNNIPIPVMWGETPFVPDIPPSNKPVEQNADTPKDSLPFDG
ncbi:MAG TPA: hypothetical protein PKJ85_01865 [Nitrosomonas nitrosa]|nr:hypothetical protein [Nitrosomonas nitrosa]